MKKTGYKMADKVFEISLDTKLLEAVFGSASAAAFLDRALDLTAQLLQANMVQQAPIDTGRLRGSIQFPEKIASLKYQISINAKYWEALQFGTGPYTIKPKTKKALRFVVNGQVIFAKFVNHPGIKANPFIDRAIDKTSPRIEGIVGMALDEVLTANGAGG